MEVIAQDSLNIEEIITELRAGKTIVYPTETCYGLGCDAFNAEAVGKIFAIKGRESGKPVLVLVESVEQVKPLVEWNEIHDKLAAQYWPGALTIVAVAREPATWPAGILGPDKTLAFRVSSHPVAAALVKEFGGPLVSTSANLAGQKNAYSITDIVTTIGRGTVRPDILIDAGELTPQPPSTIVRVRGGKIEILRQGTIVLS